MGGKDTGPGPIVFARPEKAMARTSTAHADQPRAI